MATAPASRKLNLTRDQLAEFLTDQQQIRQFEKLFSVVDELQVITGTDFEYQADTAAATANEALAQIRRLVDAVDLLSSQPAIEKNNSVATDYIDFNSNAPYPANKVGRLHWNGGYTLNLDMTPDVNQSIGEAQYYYIKASAAIAKGELVMFDGAVGASGVLQGKPSTGVTNGQLIMGVAAEAIANNGFGLVSSFGLVRGFNTTGTPYGEVWVDGDILYYNPSFAGGLTKTQPTAPLPHIVVAAVVNAATAGSGSVFVRVQAEPLVSQLSDVYAPTPATGDVLLYDGVQQRWENVQISSAVYSASGAPITKTADFSVANGETWLINNKAGSSCTVTLPIASTNTGRVLHFQNYQAQTLVSASSNVIPLAGGAATTAILGATAGANATLVSNGTNWIITQ